MLISAHPEPSRGTLRPEPARSDLEEKLNSARPELVEGRNNTTGLEEPKRSLQPVSTRPPPDPIGMLAQAYREGARVIVLTDQHRSAPGTNYSDFLETLVERLHREAGVNLLFMETHPDVVEKNVLPFLQSWNGSPEEDFQTHLQKHLSSLGFSGKMGNVDGFSFSHLFPALRLAFRLGMSIRGFDPRESTLLSGVEVGNSSLPLSGGDTERGMAEAVWEQLEESGPAARALVMVGEDHVFPSPRLKRMSWWLKQKMGEEQVKTVLTILGWREIIEQFQKLPVRLRDTPLPRAAEADLKQSPWANVQANIGLLSYKLPIWERDSWIPVWTGEYDGLIYFRDQEAIAGYLQEGRRETAPGLAAGLEEADRLRSDRLEEGERSGEKEKTVEINGRGGSGAADAGPSSLDSRAPRPPPRGSLRPNSQTRFRSFTSLQPVATQPEGRSQNSGVQQNANRENPEPKRLLADEGAEDQPTQNDRPSIGQKADQRSLLVPGQLPLLQDYQQFPPESIRPTTQDNRHKSTIPQFAMQPISSPARSGLEEELNAVHPEPVEGPSPAAGLEESTPYPLPVEGLGDFKHESYLNRHRPQWRWLRENALSQLLQSAMQKEQQRGQRRLHILIFGASTGEELARAFHEIVTWLEERGREVAADLADKTRWQIYVSGIDLDEKIVAKGQDRIQGKSPFFWTEEPDWFSSRSYDYAKDVIETLNRHRTVARENIQLYSDDLRSRWVQSTFSDVDLILWNSTLYQLGDQGKKTAPILQYIDETWPQAWMATDEGPLPGMTAHHTFIDGSFSSDPLQGIIPSYSFGIPKLSSTDLEEPSAAQEPELLSRRKSDGRMYVGDGRWIVPFLGADDYTKVLIETLRIPGMLRPEMEVLDLGIGDGAATAGLAGKVRRVIGVDEDPTALEWARTNFRLNGLVNVELFRGDFFDPRVRARRYPLIVVNPPALPLPLKAKGAFHPSAWLAIYGGPDGRQVMERILREAPSLLTPDGALLMVHSHLLDLGKTQRLAAQLGLKIETLLERDVPIVPPPGYESMLLRFRESIRAANGIDLLEKDGHPAFRLYVLKISKIPSARSGLEERFEDDPEDVMVKRVSRELEELSEGQLDFPGAKEAVQFLKIYGPVPFDKDQQQPISITVKNTGRMLYHRAVSRLKFGHREANDNAFVLTGLLHGADPALRTRFWLNAETGEITGRLVRAPVSSGKDSRAGLEDAEAAAGRLERALQALFSNPAGVTLHWQVMGQSIVKEFPFLATLKLSRYFVIDPGGEETDTVARGLAEQPNVRRDGSVHYYGEADDVENFAQYAARHGIAFMPNPRVLPNPRPRDLLRQILSNLTDLTGYAVEQRLGDNTLGDGMTLERLVRDLEALRGA